MKLKGWTKLSIQIGILSISMIALSFLTETDMWLEYFNTKVKIEGGCNYGFCFNDTEEHYHWNYRGWVYFITGLAYFFISVIKIIVSHDEKDFKK